MTGTFKLKRSITVEDGYDLLVAGGGPHVIVYDQLGNPVFNQMVYSAAFLGGVRVATGDINLVFTISEAVTDFTIDDITVSSGTKSAFSQLSEFEYSG